MKENLKENHNAAIKENEKEKEIVVKSKHIETLVNGLNKYTNIVNDKIKVNRIFSQIDKRANGEFKELLKLSEKQYKSIKSGNSISSFIKHSKTQLEPILRRVVDDPIYNRNDYIEEKQHIQNRFLLQIDHQSNKVLKDTRENIKSKPDTQVLINKNLSPTNRKTVQFQHDSNISLVPNPTNLLLNNLHAESLNNENMVFLTNMRNYKNYLKNIEVNEENEKKDNSNMKYFSSNFALNYKSVVKQVVKDDKNKYEGLNINRLINSTVKLKTYKEVNSTNKEKSFGINITKDNNDTEISKSRHSVKDSIYNLKPLKVASLQEKEFYYSNVNEYMHKYPNNTVSTIRYELLRNRNTEEHYEEKKDLINKCIYTGVEILKPNEIEKKVARNNIINQNKVLAKKIMINNSKAVARSSLYGTEIDTSQIQSEADKEKRKENKMFLINNKNERSPQIYVDPYSSYDNKINKRIIEFNKQLGTSHYDKRRMNDKLNDYIFKMKVDKDNNSQSLTNKLHNAFNFNKDTIDKLSDIGSRSISNEGRSMNNKLRHSVFREIIDNNNNTNINFQDFQFGLEDNMKQVKKLVEEDWTRSMIDKENKSKEEDYMLFEEDVRKREENIFSNRQKS